MVFELKAEAEMRLHSDRLAAELARLRREEHEGEEGADDGIGESVLVGRDFPAVEVIAGGGEET
jgi:hypothetical protein